MKSAAIAFALALTISANARGQQIQYGIRVNSMESMQWSGSTIYVEGSRRGVMKTTSGTIHQIWPGPAPGSYAIHSAKGVGVLAGQDAMILARVGAANAIFRSSRPDAIWIASWDAAAGKTQIAEWHGPQAGRVLVEVPARLTDFDVSGNGTLALLQSDGSIHLSAGQADRKPVPHPLEDAPLRVFLNSDLSEIAVLGRSRLCRFGVATKKWACSPFDPATQAVVRHAWSGRPALEEKFGAGAGRPDTPKPKKPVAFPAVVHR